VKDYVKQNIRNHDQLYVPRRELFGDPGLSAGVYSTSHAWSAGVSIWTKPVAAGVQQRRQIVTSIEMYSNIRATCGKQVENKTEELYINARSFMLLLYKGVSYLHVNICVVLLSALFYVLSL